MTPLSIVQVSPGNGDYCLHLSFSDGTERNVDFRPFLSAARHPTLRAFLDPARFAGYRLEYGDLVWGDYELCFPIADLYDNRLIHVDIPLAA